MNALFMFGVVLLVIAYFLVGGWLAGWVGGFSVVLGVAVLLCWIGAGMAACALIAAIFGKD